MQHYAIILWCIECYYAEYQYAELCFLCHYVERHYSESSILFGVMLSAVILCVIMLSFL
jgi:hypothetical protein